MMGENLTCQMCGASFKSKAELDEHNKVEHKQPSETTASGQKKSM